MFSSLKQRFSQYDILAVLILSIACKILGIPPLIALAGYAYGKIKLCKPKTFDHFAIVDHKQEGDMIIYTLNTFKPYSEVVQSREKLEHYWNTNIIRFDQHGTNKKVIFVYTQKVLGKEFKTLKALKEWNPQSLGISENDFYESHKFKVSCEFKDITANIKMLKDFLGARVILQYPYITIKYRKPEKIIPLPEVVNQRKKGLILGVNMDTGKPFGFSWDSGIHFLVAGKTGAGKSVTAHTIIDSAMYYDTDMAWLMYDGKLVELARYKEFPNVQYTNDMKEFESFLDKVLDIMKARYQEMSRQKVSDYTGKRLIVCIDEIAVIRNTLGKKNDTISPKLIRILNEGRASRIHMVIFTQRPQVDQMDVSLRESMPTTIGMFMSSKDGKRFMELDGLNDLQRGTCIVKSMDLKDLARVQIAFSKENQYNEVFSVLEGHFLNKSSLAKIPGGTRTLESISEETISVLDYFKDKASSHYKLVKSIVQLFVESLDGLGTMPRTADHEQALGLQEKPRKLRELKEWAVKEGLIYKINHTKYGINKEEIRQWIEKYTK
jgi:hypothetical protein